MSIAPPRLAAAGSVEWVVSGANAFAFIVNPSGVRSLQSSACRCDGRA